MRSKCKIILIISLAMLLSCSQNGFKNKASLQIKNSTASGITIAFKNRSLFEKEFNTPGIVDLCHYILENEYKKMENQFDALGCELQFYDYAFIPFDDYYTRHDMSFIRVKVPNSSVDKTLFLLKTLVDNTKNLDEKALEAASKSCVRSNMMRRGSVKDTALNHLKSILFKDDYPTMGFYAGREGYPFDTVKQFIHVYFSSENIVLGVAGEFNQTNVNRAFREIFNQAEPDPKVVEYRKAEKSSEYTLITEINKGVQGKQGYVLAAIPLISELDRDVNAALTCFTSSLSEKLTFQLREKEGLAYSMGASMSSLGGHPFILINMATSPENVDYAAEKIQTMATDILKETIPDRELEKNKNRLLTSRIMKDLTNVNKSFWLTISRIHNKPDNDRELFNSAIRNTSLDSLNQAKTLIDLSKMIIVKVK